MLCYSYPSSRIPCCLDLFHSYNSRQLNMESVWRPVQQQVWASELLMGWVRSVSTEERRLEQTGRRFPPISKHKWAVRGRQKCLSINFNESTFMNFHKHVYCTSLVRPGSASLHTSLRVTCNVCMKVCTWGRSTQGVWDLWHSWWTSEDPANSAFARISGTSTKAFITKSNKLCSIRFLHKQE